MPCGYVGRWLHVDLSSNEVSAHPLDEGDAERFVGGSGLAAAAVFVWGSIVMLAGDHFVWPTLVSGSARLPFLLVFVGIFGGLAAFGLIGLFVGPVIMAALLAMWREWIFRPPP